MFPPIYPLVKASAAVTALLGAEPRFYPFGEAPQGVQRPYAVWQVVGGAPLNYLRDRPDMDELTIQVDIYADTAASAHAVAVAVRNAIEGDCYITRWAGEDRDPETNDYRLGFDAEWHVPRQT